MFVPEPPTLNELNCITPSIYEASVGCLAKAAWHAFGERGVLPEHPAAILGTSFHAVVEAAQRGELVVTSDSDRAPARQLFDETTQALYSEAHQLIRLKFVTPDRLPYYNLQRERATLLATRIAFSRLSAGNPSVRAPITPPPGPQIESRMCSVDGLIVGRPDHLNGKMQTVVDYKSGYAAESNAVSDSEARQLRLYAYLAIDNGIPVSKGVIVRGDGRRCDLSISTADAEEEANKARSRLKTLNEAIRGGAVFNDLASPSSQNCCFCPCIPFCDSFWVAAKPDWESDCGSHVEGEVLDAETHHILGIYLTTLKLMVRSGTISNEQVSVEQIPSDWMMLQGEDLPSSGSLVRIVHGRQSDTDESTAVIRVDKAFTTVWRIPSENSNSDG